ncbi:MAG: hypothetical protein ABIK09_18385 [Pseudomonadota bacterium]
MTRAFILALALTLLTAAPAQADVYINGQQVRGVTGLTLENCTVTFNLKGEVHITAPGYKVAAAAALGEQSRTMTQPTGPIASVSNRYFLVTRTSTPGSVPLDFEVLVGGKMVKTISSEDNGLVVELTLFLSPGKNSVEIRSLAKTTVAGAPSDSFGMIIGRGAPNAGSLEIEDVLLNYEVTANDPAPRTDRFEITVK